MDEGPSYKPLMSEERIEALRRWHEKALQQGRRMKPIVMEFLGRTFRVPPEVIPPNQLGLGETVLKEVTERDRVLDMGTGSGVNAILAASRAHHVVAVDVNPVAVRCARSNAAMNGVADRIDVREGDLFERVSGEFDLILFDPPFRWFPPRDLFERATTDENYRGLTQFFVEVRDHLAPGGRVLLYFGTSGDLEYLRLLIDRSGLRAEELTRVGGEKDVVPVEYFVYRLTPPSSESQRASGSGH